jgi:hypothetical protein
VRPIQNTLSINSSQQRKGLFSTCIATPGYLHYIVMKFFRPAVAVLALIALAAATTAARAQSTLTVDDIIQKAVARTQQALSKSPSHDYTYTKVSVVEELDATGKIKDRKEKVYQVSLASGETWVKLISVNGQAPGEADRKQHAENEMNVQKLTGSSKQKKDNREVLLTPELVARFDFELVTEKIINGRRAYQVAFRPKNPEPPVRHLIDRLLNRISGTIYIDAEEFEIAQTEITLGSEVNLLGGIAGSLKKLAYTMTRTRLDDGIWLNTFSSGDFEGRKLLDSTRIKTRSRSINFRPRIAS